MVTDVPNGGLNYVLKFKKQLNKKEIEETEHVERTKCLKKNPSKLWIPYIFNFLFVLNDLKEYGCTNLSFTISFRKSKEIELHPSILSSKFFFAKLNIYCSKQLSCRIEHLLFQIEN
jgi:hypothetical protein